MEMHQQKALRRGIGFVCIVGITAVVLLFMLGLWG
jgi:hypothetical protein